MEAWKAGIQKRRLERVQAHSLATTAAEEGGSDQGLHHMGDAHRGNRGGNLSGPAGAAPYDTG